METLVFQGCLDLRYSSLPLISLMEMAVKGNQLAMEEIERRHLDNELTKHAPGKHDQKTHAGNRGSGIQDTAFDETNSRTFDRGQDDEIYRIMRDEQKEFIDSLSQDELEAIQTYQGMEYEQINGDLRSGAKLSAENQEVVRTLDSVIERSMLEYNTKVYRGISDDTGVFETISIGDVLEDKGFASTSLNPAVAEAFANSTIIEGSPVVLEIDVPWNTPALASDLASAKLADDFAEGLSVRLDDNDMIAELGGYVRLNEITLPRNLKMRVTEIEEKENARYVKVAIEE